MRIPEKYKHLWPAEKPGTRIDRLIVDMEHGAQEIISLAWDLEKDGKISIQSKEDTRWPASAPNS